MRTMRLRLFLAVALVVGLGLGGVWLLLERPTQRVASPGEGTGPQPVQAATFDGSRTESRAGQEVKLEEVFGFNRELAPWLSEFREQHTVAGVRAGALVRQPEQVASLSDGRGRSDAR